MRSSKLFAFAAASLMAVPAFAQDSVRPLAPPLTPATPTTNPATPGGSDANATVGRVAVATVFPSKKLTGLNVRNSQGEKIGTIDDLVINLQDGKIQYVALSVGGVLGIGDKLFAVPFQEVRFNHGKDEMYYVLDISKEKLEQAPGFDKAHWPDFADPQWKTTVDSYYRDKQAGTASRPSSLQK
jgi:sporulation protein YlmC with PRC-barrel domain